MNLINCEPEAVSLAQNCKEESYHTPPRPASMKESENFDKETESSEQKMSQMSFSPHENIFLQKRALIMKWVQGCGEKFQVSRNAVALTQLFIDYYYSSYDFISEEALKTAAVILVIASKFSDTKSLDSNTIAYIFDFEPRSFTTLEIQVCWKLDFNFAITTYATVVDQGIHTLKDVTGINLYEQKKQSYTLLRLIHFVFEQIYVSTGLQPVLQDVLFCIFRLTGSHLFSENAQISLRKPIDEVLLRSDKISRNFVSDFVSIKKSDEKSYQQFSVEYFSFKDS